MRMNASLLASLALGLLGLMSTGCSTSPTTDNDREVLHDSVQTTLKQMRATDATIGPFLDKSYGYVVFPNVGKGGFIVGGAWGRGEVYEQGRQIGYGAITQGSVGLQAGGQDFAEIIVFEDKPALDRFINNRLELAANFSAVALRSGIGASAKYTNGVAVFVDPKGGLMAEAAIGGQRFTFSPLR